MSDPAGRAPRTDAEWAREVSRRLDALEQAPTTRIGPWVLGSVGGNLMATAPGKQVDLSNPAAGGGTGGVTPAQVEKSIGDLLTDLVKAITNNVGETLQHLIQWGSDLLNNAGQVIGNIWGVIVDAGHTVGDFFTRILDGLVGKVWTAATGFLGELWDAVQRLFHKNEKAYNYAIAPRVFGAWQADLTDDVSFAMSLIDGRATPQPGQRILIPLTSHKERNDVDAVKVGMYGIPSEACYMALYRVRREDATEPDAYGNLAKAGKATLFMDMGDVTECLRATTSDLRIVRFAETRNPEGVANPITISTDPGDLFYLEVVQTGVTVEMAAWSAVPTISTGLIPKSLRLARKGTFPGSIPPQDSFEDIDVITSGTGLAQYWGAMGKAVSQLDTGRDDRVTFVDLFNRYDTTYPDIPARTAGPDWAIRVASPTYRPPTVIDPWGSNIPALRRKNGVPAPDFALDTQGNWLACTRRLATINQQIEASIWWEENVPTNTRLRMGLSLHGDGAGRFVYARIIYDIDDKRWTTRIFTYDNGTEVERGLDNSGKQAGPFYLPFDQYPNIQDTFRYRVTNENSYSVQFKLGADGQDWFNASEWVDSTDAFKVTDANTEVGVFSYNDFRADKFALIDNFIARDL